MNGEYTLEAARFLMLTEALRDAGFATAAVTNLPAMGWSAKATWIAQGFQTLVNYDGGLIKRFFQEEGRCRAGNQLAVPVQHRRGTNARLGRVARGDWA